MCNISSSHVLLGLGLFLAACTPRAAAAPADPVEDLRKLLEQWDGLPGEDTPEGKKEVTALGDKLLKQAREVRSLPDLAQAFLLSEWRSNYLNKNTKAYELTAAALRRLADQFRLAAKEVIDRGDATKRAALAALVSALADRVWSDVRPVVLSMLRDLTPDLLTLATPRDDVPAVAVMLERLGKLDSSLKRNVDVVTPLAQLLTSQDVHVKGRRAVAATLESLIAIRVDDIQPRLVPLAETLPLALALIPAAVGGLGDRDAEVRGRCLETLRQTMLTVRSRLNVPDRLEQPEQGRFFAQELERLQPLVEAVEKALPAVRMRIEDEETTVRLAGCQTVETLAEVRRIFLRAAAAELKVKDKVFAAPWGKELRQALAGLEKNMVHKEVRLRLGALYALESYAAEAASISAAVLKALSDESHFVRWAAVRVLGRIAPQAADKAVPALAERLTDESEDVRLTAALVLGRYGPSASPAVPALTRTVEKGNAVLRLRAITSLAAIGREANDSQPALVLALAASEGEVREAAAQAFTRIGPLSDRALASLRKALSDSNAEVRRAASIALLQDK